ncbi:MAG: glycosyltransferase [Elusimicrobia bacterium]|nr:glycosyltransferase [Elusimicrobiota bacterium]
MPFPLSVVIPAYNEEDRLPRTLERLRAWRPKEFDPLQIILVDDGSKDRTREVVRERMKQDPRLELVEATHGGTMHAVTTGYGAAKHAFVANMDADCATDPSEFARLVPFLPDYDIVTGSRILREGLPDIEGKSGLRRLLSAGMSLLFLGLFRCKVRDPQIGFRILRREALDRVLPLLRSPHDGIKCAEMLVKAQGLGYRIREVAVIHTHDPDSRCVPKGRAAGIAAAALKALIGVWVDAAAQFREGLLSQPVARAAALAPLVGRVLGTPGRTS